MKRELADLTQDAAELLACAAVLAESTHAVFQQMASGGRPTRAEVQHQSAQWAKQADGFRRLEDAFIKFAAGVGVMDDDC